MKWLGLLLASQAGAALPAEDLRTGFEAAHSYHRERLADQFAENSFDRSVLGRPFRLEVSFNDGTAREVRASGPHYTYRNGKLLLLFSAGPRAIGSGLNGPRMPSANIGGRNRPGGSYTGANAYGVTARVTRIFVEQDALALVSAPEGLPSPYTRDLPSYRSYGPEHDYWVELEMSGVDARQLASNARVVIEGTTAPLPGEEPVRCEGDYAGATVSNPRAVIISTCWIGAEVQRISIIDRRDGQVLRSWPQ